MPLLDEMLSRAVWTASENWEPSVRTPVSVEAINNAFQRLADGIREYLRGEQPVLEGLEAAVPWRRLLEALHSGFLQVLQTDMTMLSGLPADYPDKTEQTSWWKSHTTCALRSVPFCFSPSDSIRGRAARSTQSRSGSSA
jgi:hypothetical protein